MGYWGELRRGKQGVKSLYEANATNVQITSNLLHILIVHPA
jgi:hypothetical protein